MSREAKAIDISDQPVLLRLAEEVQSSNEPRIVRRADKDLAILMPVKPRRKPRTKAVADDAAFRSAFPRRAVDEQPARRQLPSPVSARRR